MNMNPTVKGIIKALLILGAIAIAGTLATLYVSGVTR